MKRSIKISVGSNRWATQWDVKAMAFSDFCDRLRTPVRGVETLGEYYKLPKSERDRRKDVGGFVGGVVVGGARKVGNITSRDLITLDLDNIKSGGADEILNAVQSLGVAAVVYSTRKHRPAAPRLRIVIPTDRPMTPEEYEPTARMMARLISMDSVDPTTFELNRLMYWPSVSSDSEYIFRTWDGDFSAVDDVLGMYADWTDATSWPTAEGEHAAEARRMAHQVDPTTKSGIVGAFCRAYSLLDAMEAFLPGIYSPTVHDDRYTYVGGSTTGGAIVYEDKWLYSHHATDPTSGQLVNAWDLVRLHKFGDQDEMAKPGTPPAKLPSWQKMIELVNSDARVPALMLKERQENAVDVFKDVQTAAAAPETEAPEEPAEDWHLLLKYSQKGDVIKSIDNLLIILQNDPELKDKVITDEFAGCGLADGALPWDPRDERRRWTDTDDAGALWYMERTYGIGDKNKLTAALALIGARHSINEVRDYLLGLEWDGAKRLETIFSDYLGAEDNIYTRAVARKSLCAAVSRAVTGGTKYDYMPILAGPQGLGKSTFLATLGKNWFSDSLATFEGKEAAEMLQGTWINEVGELTAMTRYESSAVKQFLSKRSDIYRAAYGRRTEEHPRRCVFFGTSNDIEFLKSYIYGFAVNAVAHGRKT